MKLPDVCADALSLLLSAFEAIDDGIVVLDAEGAVTEANPAFARMLGYSMEELSGMHVWEWDAGRPREALEEILGENRLHDRFVTRHKRKDGSTFEAEVSQNAAEFGGKRYDLCVCRDISQRLEAERECDATQKELAAEVARRRLLVEQSRDGIVVLDETGLAVETNLEFAHMLGYTMDEMATLHVYDWECEYPRETVESMISTVGAEGDHFVSRHRRKDGSTYEVEISTNAAEYGGHKYVFCICRDVSAQLHEAKEREELISQLQQALAELKTLRGIIPVCSFCKKVRDDRGYWEQVDVYIRKHSEADVSHGICPDCLKKHFPGMTSGAAVGAARTRRGRGAGDS
jgi:PAS domain S-box-containing protein